MSEDYIIADEPGPLQVLKNRAEILEWWKGKIEKMSNEIQVGDSVRAVKPFALVCGSGMYDHATCVQVSPMVLVSPSGDMLWSATLYAGCVEKIGRASAHEIENANRRWANERKV